MAEGEGLYLVIELQPEMMMSLLTLPWPWLVRTPHNLKGTEKCYPTTCLEGRPWHRIWRPTRARTSGLWSGRHPGSCDPLSTGRGSSGDLGCCPQPSWTYVGQKLLERRKDGHPRAWGCEVRHPTTTTFQPQPGGSDSTSVKSGDHFPAGRIFIKITWGNMPLYSQQLSLEGKTLWWKTPCPIKPFSEFEWANLSTGSCLREAWGRQLCGGSAYKYTVYC